jgi:hypothetical protein
MLISDGLAEEAWHLEDIITATLTTRRTRIFRALCVYYEEGKGPFETWR